MDKYLDTQDAIDDFEALRKEDPGKAMIFALERKYGKAKETMAVEGDLMLAKIREEFRMMEVPPSTGNGTDGDEIPQLSPPMEATN